ncbi:MAG: hypothetical protein ABIE42_08360 [Candidatus Eisenbacteria bacterium]
MRAVALVTTALTLAILTIAAPAMAVVTFFDVISDSVAVAGPPYPTSCHRTDVAHEASGVFERDGQLALGVRSATDGAGSPLSIELRAGEAHVPGCNFEEDTHFDVIYCSDPDGAALPSESVVAVFIELTSFGGRRGKLVTLHPELPITDPGRFFDTHSGASSLEIVCRVEFDRGVQHELTLRGELPEGLSLTSTAIVIREQSLESGGRADPTVVDSYFTANPDGFFDIRLRLEGAACLDDLSTVLSLTFSGRFLGGTSPVEATTWGAIKALYDN